MLKHILLRPSNILYRVDHNKARRIGLVSRYHMAVGWERNVFNFQPYKCVYYPQGIHFVAPLLTCQGLDHFRMIFTSSLSFTTHFVESENLFAHKILERNSAYSDTLAPKYYLNENEEISDDEFENMITKDWSNESTESAFVGLKKILYCRNKQHSISEEIFYGLIKALVEKCSQLSDDDLIGILDCLRIWPKADGASCRNYTELWNAVDKQCVLRMVKWDRNKLLLVADHLYLLRLARMSTFMWKCTLRLSRRPEKLTPSQLVQFMFYINVRRKFPSSISTYNFEYSLQNCLDQLTLDELGIFAMGFFKSEKPIRSQDLLTDLMRCIMNSVDSIHEITLAALLKVIRYSLQPTHADILFVLMDKLTPHIKRLSLMCCTHIALAGTNIHLYHEEMINKIVQRFVNEIRSSRMKDLERLTFTLSLYNYEHKMEPSIYKLIAEELCRSERTEEIKQYPKCLPSSLHFLSLQKIFLKEEINKVLDMNFIRDVYGKSNYKVGREILCLDTSVELECPDYNGNRLDPKLRTILARIHTKNVWEYEDLLGKKKLGATNQILLEVITAAVSVLGGHEKVHLGHIIPNLERADIVYGIQANGSVVDIPGPFRNLKIGTCKRPPNFSDTKWFCIVIGGWNSYIKILNKPVGSMTSKLRQLRLLGYNPIVVPFFEWKLLPMEEQEKYLAKKIWEDFQDKVSCIAK